MDANNDESINEMKKLFQSESIKVKNTINQFLKNFEELNVPEIIGVYYQVINVKSLVTSLKLNLEKIGNSKENENALIVIQKTEKYIEKNFDKNLHPLIMSKLKKIIYNSKNEIKNSISKKKEKTKEDLEVQAKMYEKLRQVMSTKEFADQYNKGLSRDMKD